MAGFFSKFKQLFNRKKQMNIRENIDDADDFSEIYEDEMRDEFGTKLTNEDNQQTDEYEVVEREILPGKIICPDCGGITLEGLDFCDKCGGELMNSSK